MAMNQVVLRGRGTLARLALVGAVATLAGLALGSPLASPPEARAVPPQAEVFLVGPGGCGLNGSKCWVQSDQPFRVSIGIDNVNLLNDWDMDTKVGLTAAQFEVRYDGLIFLPKVHNWVWPGCDVELSNSLQGNYQLACLTLSNEAVYEGVLVEIEFNCAASGLTNQFILTGPDLAKDDGNPMTLAVTNSIVLVNCLDAVGGVAEVPDAAREPATTPDDLSGPGAGTRAGVMAAAAVAGALALGGAALHRRRLGR